MGMPLHQCFRTVPVGELGRVRAPAWKGNPHRPGLADCCVALGQSDCAMPSLRLLAYVESVANE